MSDKVYTVQDYKSGQPRWCPGCGDHAFLNSLHKAMAELGTAPHDIAVISGLGCSSRLPYYRPEYDSVEQPYLRSDKRTIVTDFGTRTCNQVFSLRNCGRPLPSR